MIEDTENRHGKRQDVVHLIIGILVFGSIWGFLEATLGGFLHMIIFPNKGAIMSSIGVAIMASALAIYGKPGLSVGIGVIAASFKLLDVIIFALPITSIHIINPAMAIIFEALAFALATAVVLRKMDENLYVGIITGIIVGIISAIAWVYFAIYVMNAPAYARVVFTAGTFITNQGVVQAVFFGAFLPLGYLAGKKLAAKTPMPLTNRPLYYATSSAMVVFCWGASALAIIAGL